MERTANRTAIMALLEARENAWLQTRAVIDGGLRARWYLQLNLLDRAIGSLAGVDGADVSKLVAELQEGLTESVKLQSHYAELLDTHDCGRRLRFASAA